MSQFNKTGNEGRFQTRATCYQKPHCTKQHKPPLFVPAVSMQLENIRVLKGKAAGGAMSLATSTATSSSFGVRTIAAMLSARSSKTMKTNRR